jgi:hypothetical protein
MISVIICSANPIQLQEVSQNILETIGFPYELIAIDNRSSKRGICSVYNEAALSAKFNYLCFVHEDVKFHTQNWGNVINEIFSDDEIALIGVSGSVYKSATPGSWVSCDKKYYRVNTLQHQHDNNTVERVSLNPKQDKISDVAVIDGVLMVTRKNILNQCCFDEDLLKGFHGYDLDFSFSTRKFGKVVVTHEILLEHFSLGSFTIDWLKDSLLINEKWLSILPIHAQLTKHEDHFSDYIATVSLLTHLLRFHENKKLVIKYYSMLLFKWFDYNRFRFTKTVAKYLLFHQTNLQ